MPEEPGPRHAFGRAARLAAGLVTAALLAIPLSGTVPAQNLTFFRIATGGTAGTYYPIGALIANAISNPPGSRPCEDGGRCGVPGLIAIAQSSAGSVGNVALVQSGQFESAFSQSDVAYWAYTGTGLFEDRPPASSIRAIANLYPEHVHIVAGKDSGIATVRDLRGKRVSLDEPGSGTLVDARIVLDAYGVAEDELKASYLKAGPSADRLRAGTLDAFFIVAGYPTGAVIELADSIGIELVPIDGPEADTIVDAQRFLSKSVIPEGVYRGIGDTATLSVGAQWIVGAKVDDELVYEITKALWNSSTRRLLDSGHAQARSIRLETALAGIAIPLHPGAERFYREIGMIE